MNKPKISLIHKAVLGIMLVLLPIVVIDVVSYHRNKEHLRNSVLSDMDVISAAYETQIYQFIEMNKNRAVDFSSDGLIRDELRKIARGGSNKTLNAHLLANKMPLDRMIRIMHVVDLRGRVASSTDSALVGADVSREAFFLDGRSRATIVEANAVASNVYMLAFSAPLSDRETNERIGVIVNFVALEELSRLLRGEYERGLGITSHNSRARRSFEAYVVDKNRFLLTESMFVKDAVSRQKVDTEPVRNCLENGKEMRGFYTGYRGVEVAGASHCIPQLGWTLIAEVDADEVFESAAMMRRDALIAAILMVISLVLVLYFFYYKSIISRIQGLLSATAEIGRGNYDVKLAVESGDEIGVLSGAVNAMAREISARTVAHKMSEARLAEAQRIARLGNWDWDMVKNTLYWSDEIYRIFGATTGDFEATYEAFLERVHPDDREKVKRSVADAISTKTPYKCKHRVIWPDGREFVVHELGEVTYDTDGKPLRMVGTVHDITELAHAEAELSKLSTVIEQSVNIVIITDFDGRIEYVNPVFERVTGYRLHEAIGQNPRMLSSGETTQETYRMMWSTIKSGGTWRGEVKNRKKDGSYYWAIAIISPVRNDAGAVTHFLGVQEDITEKRAVEERLRFLASYDELTGIFNRVKFTEEMNMRLLGAVERQTGIVVFHIDIDQFRVVNDTYGHATGDVLIKRVAEVLKAAFVNIGEETGKKAGEMAVIARMGADEFGVIFETAGDADGAREAEYVRKAIEGCCADELDVRITVSVGLARFPQDGLTSKELLTKADAALFRAKLLGGNRVHAYSPEDGDLEQMKARLKGRERIQKAIDNDLFAPWFQPILDLKTGKVCHYESLARLHEDGKVLTPGAFIDVAERFGMIGYIDRIIMLKAMMKQAESRRTHGEISFSMNLSGKDLCDDTLLDYIKHTIERTGASPEHIIFEITETAAIGEIGRAKKFISALKEFGCKFSLDDFGVGFTSFVYLKELKVDYIKIDGYFIKNLDKNPEDQIFVKAIAGVAKGLGIKTVAEFVETKEAFDLLKSYDIDYLQGYFIGKPAPDIGY
jgi:diguanylate cyclase (GGDEF)-like protein/PAS domain S-box-containing protein